MKICREKVCVVISMFVFLCLDLVIQLLVQLADLLLVLLTLLLRNADHNGGGIIVQNGALLHRLDAGHHVRCGLLSLRHILS